MADAALPEVNIADLILSAKLEDVVYREVSGRLFAEAETDAASEIFDIMVRRRTGQVDVRCVLHVHGGGGAYTADAVGTFDLAEAGSLSEPAIATFAQAMADRVVYPYLREAVTQSAAKLRLPPPALKLHAPKPARHP